MRFSGFVVGIERVLCSTAHLHRQAWEAVFIALGIPCAGIAALDFSTLGRTQGLDKLLESANVRLSASERETLLEEKNALYRNLLSTLCADDLLPGTRALLEEAKAAGLCVGAATTSKNAVLTLKYLGLADFFDAVSDGNDLFPRDAPGLVYSKACEYMGILPAQCLIWEGVSQKALEAEAMGLRAVLGDCAKARAALFSPGAGTRSDGSMLAV